MRKGVHLVAPANADVPASQRPAHSADPGFAAKVPALQLAHCAAAEAEKVPARQVAHLVEAVSGAAEPAVQLRQTEAATLAW